MIFRHHSLTWRAMVWQPLRSHFGRTLLSVLAIALGVALGLAIQLMNRAATTEMSRASRSLFGEADLVVRGNSSGFDEALYAAIARLPGVAAASPVVEVHAPVVGRRDTLTVLGMDMLRAASLQSSAFGSTRNRADLSFFNEDNIVLSAAAAALLQVKVGDSIAVQVSMRPMELKVAAVMPGDTSFGLVDIAIAQWRFEHLGKLSRIDLRLQRDADATAVAAAIRTVLPEGVAVVTPTEEVQQSLQLSRAFRVNLTALALVALFTGAFLVYATQSLAVIRRRSEFALLHALGVTPREQVVSVIATGTLLGILGAVLGVALGVVLAKVGLQAFVAQLAGSNAPAAEATFAEALGYLLLGVLVSVGGSVFPAISAARIPTAVALKAGNVDAGPVRSHAAWGVVLWIVSIPLMLAPPVFNLPLFGYVAIALILFGAVLCIPAFTRSVLTWLPSWGNVSYRTALAQLRGAAHTSRQSVASILVSVSLMVAMAIMITSLRGSFVDWLSRIFPADIYVQAGTQNSSAYLDDATLQSLQAISGVKHIALSRTASILLPQSSTPVALIARDPNDKDKDNDAPIAVESGARRPAPPGAIPIWISVALADRYRLAPDDSVAFRLGKHDVVGSVRGVWRDYQFQQTGALLMNYRQYRQLTDDPRVNSASLWIDGDASLEAVLSSVRSRIGDRLQVSIGLPAEYRARSLRAFDSVFAITYLLLAVAVLIGMFGISVNASAQVLARRAEFGVLRHLGFTRGQIGTMLGIEGLCLGSLGMIAGLVIGACISGILIHIVGRQSFHWTMDLHVPAGALVILSCIVPVAAALTSLWSGRGAIGSDIVHAVKEDW